MSRFDGMALLCQLASLVDCNVLRLGYSTKLANRSRIWMIAMNTRLP